ncbi:MAG TPA: entericidin A/B family lipoprotein [Dissulfurispiraceae bacterium]|nr:entericidin A/B family lipoprotein [Dissulfurispiraceae bacterium]
MLKKCVSLLIICFFCAALAACNTVEGVGKDVSSVGRAVERSTGK